ncbi:MAG: hypothetical protein AAFY60_16315 [Myxococcota bacterium]
MRATLLIAVTSMAFVGCASTRTGFNGKQCTDYIVDCADRTVCEIDENGCELCTCFDSDDPRFASPDPLNEPN